MGHRLLAHHLSAGWNWTFQSYGTQVAGSTPAGVASYQEPNRASAYTNWGCLLCASMWTQPRYRRGRGTLRHRQRSLTINEMTRWCTCVPAYGHRHTHTHTHTHVCEVEQCLPALSPVNNQTLLVPARILGRALPHCIPALPPRRPAALDVYLHTYLENWRRDCGQALPAVYLHT